MKEISLREKEMRFLVLFYFHENTELETITRGVPQGSILGLLLFLLYGNDLKNAINLLDAIMYADDINLFLTHKDISYLSETTNLQLERINQWLISNKLSINVSKAMYSFFTNRAKGTIFLSFYQN